ncbi:hypothetical protein GGX14DRAFT_459549 [Mycena pura]|uniref:Uncharacterized protein n=1 Tax=Mycena pura TaxID=153505 RepID=A0AAD6Y9Z4_9AGAR|nr:hypothetical protein GGX14DRAFT_459549 [Mycena pura]
MPLPTVRVEQFNPTKHPNMRIGEAFAQAGCARPTFEDLDILMDCEGVPRGPERAALYEAYIRRIDETLEASGGRILQFGMKPEAANGPVEDIFFCDIPDDVLSIRFFPGDCPGEFGGFFFDFYDRNKGLPCNTPRGYELELVAPQDWSGPMKSVEVTFGSEVKEGLEKFAVLERCTCSLARPGKELFRFQVPLRTDKTHHALVEAVRAPFRDRW